MTSEQKLEGFRKEVVGNLGEKVAKEQFGKINSRRAFITYLKKFSKSCEKCPVSKALAQTLSLPATEAEASWWDSSWNPLNPKFWLPGKVSWCKSDPKTGCDCLSGLPHSGQGKIDCDGVPGGGTTTPIPPTTNEKPDEKDEKDDTILPDPTP